MFLIENEKIKVSSVSHGAELMSIFANNREYLWQGDARYWSSRAILLFPFVGRLKENKFFYEGKEYVVTQHGFARHSQFEVVEQSQTHIVYKLKWSEETLKMYPFKFVFLVEYRLVNNKLENNFTIINEGENVMPFSLGGHPGFNCPFNESEVFEDYYLEFEKPETQFTYMIDNGLFAKERVQVMDNQTILNLESKMFDNDALIFEELKSKYITIKSKKNSSYVRVSIDGWKYVGIWTKEGVSPYLCIEPWTGTADDVDSTGDVFKKRNIIVLEKNAQYKNQFVIEIDA